jgi:hypothetical protein
MKLFRFTQITTASGILVGRLKRSEVRSCDLCKCLVHIDDLKGHAMWHEYASAHPQVGSIDTSRTENRGDRMVYLEGYVAEVRPV